MDQQRNWKPSLKTGIQIESRQPPTQGVKHINYKPAIQKDYHERRHMPRAHESLQGPTNDNPNYCMRIGYPMAYSNSVNEYTQEKVMT